MRRWWWPLFWTLLAIALVVRAGNRPATRGVIVDHLEFGRRLVAGEPVHGPWRSDPDAPIRPLHAPYPPSFGLLTAPFAAVDATCGHRAARVAWALLQIGALGAAALALRRVQAPPAGPPNGGAWQWLWLGGFLLGSRFLLRDLHGGGGNAINTALCILAFAAAERGAPGRAGLWLGLSLVTKPTQVWLLPVLLLLGHRRAVGWTLAIGLGLVLLTLALQRGDLESWRNWLAGSFALQTQVDPFAVPAYEFPPFEWMNQSLRCALARWFGEVPEPLAARVVWGVTPGLGWSTAAVAWLTRGVSALLLGGLLLQAWRSRHTARSRLWTVAVTLLVSTLLGPLSWKAHYVAMLPLVVLLLDAARTRRGPRWALGGFAICCLPGAELIGNAADEWTNSLYLVTGFALLLTGLGLRLARSAAAEHGEPPVGAAGDERRG